MTNPVTPFFARHACVDMASVEEQASQREQSCSLIQRRASDGTFVSHDDVPETPVRQA
ncbi:MAG TPA: hypothetical protein VGD62_06270 [Acidobacteriaceae bacterium]